MNNNQTPKDIQNIIKTNLNKFFTPEQLAQLKGCKHTEAINMAQELLKDRRQVIKKLT